MAASNERLCGVPGRRNGAKSQSILVTAIYNAPKASRLGRPANTAAAGNGGDVQYRLVGVADRSDDGLNEVMKVLCDAFVAVREACKHTEGSDERNAILDGRVPARIKDGKDHPLFHFLGTNQEIVSYFDRPVTAVPGQARNGMDLAQSIAPHLLHYHYPSNNRQ